MEGGRPFVVVYDWACGQVVSITEAVSEPEAEEGRAVAAAVHSDDTSIEVAVVRAGSLEELLEGVSARGRRASSGPSAGTAGRRPPRPRSR